MWTTSCGKDETPRHEDTGSDGDGDADGDADGDTDADSDTESFETFQYKTTTAAAIADPVPTACILAAVPQTFGLTTSILWMVKMAISTLPEKVNSQ